MKYELEEFLASKIIVWYNTFDAMATKEIAELIEKWILEYEDKYKCWVNIE